MYQKLITVNFLINFLLNKKCLQIFQDTFQATLYKDEKVHIFIKYTVRSICQFRGHWGKPDKSPRTKGSWSRNWWH